MRRKSREISIFSVSTLDIFASAMGVFMLITVVLFPYYMKNSEAVDRMRMALAEAEQMRELAAVAEQEASQQREAAEEAESKLNETHLLVAITWQWESPGIRSNDDIDLWVVDPYGNNFGPKMVSHPGFEGEFLVDTLHTPGVEVWLSEKASPGFYCIAANRRSVDRRDRALEVRGSIAHRDGRTDLPSVNISSGASSMSMAAVEVTEDGSVMVHRIEQKNLRDPFTGWIPIPQRGQRVRCPVFVAADGPKYR